MSSITMLAIRSFAAATARPGQRIVFSVNRQQARPYGQLTSYIVSPKELNAALTKNVHSKLSTAPKIIPVCASWFLPNDPTQRQGRETFRNARIPRARFFDIDEVKDLNSPYPHMLPSPEDFAKAMSQMGVRREDSVVVYDTNEIGIFSAPRVGWTMKVFGHEQVHVLNNFRLWCEEGYPLETGEPPGGPPKEYAVPRLDASKVITFEELKNIVQEQGKEGAEEVQILDARSGGRFKGSEPEPRPGLSSGHMPTSKSLPVSDLLDPKTKALLPAAELKELFEKWGVDPSKPIVSSCGTGVTAAVIDAALTEAGFPEQGRRLYDGSWTEWAQRVEPTESLIRKIGN